MRVRGGLLFVVVAGFFGCTPARAADLPPNAKIYLPLLQAELKSAWPEVVPGSMLAAMVERETCVSLKSPKCWSPNAELKTAREYGFGFGQTTITPKFNAFEDTKKLDKSLSGWRWDDRFNPQYQMRALVVGNRFNFDRLEAVPDNLQRMAMTASAHNGGLGGIFQDQRLCKADPACNPLVWFGHVETHSRKSRKKWQGYGQSAYEINRGYVPDVLYTRRVKYVGAMGE
ncbi:MAG: hypothetical protein WC091_19845 [Sulfuricellaceae bacterium]